MNEAQTLAAEVGNPRELYDELIRRINDDAIKTFAEIEADWLGLMWSLDQHRVRRVLPEGMEEGKGTEAQRLGAMYRRKGNWFARVLASLLENQTTERIAPVINVNGFSQVHQVDIAWPPRNEDPLICAESKVTGAPAFVGTPERGALADFVNRRKELKFAATDLKLYRRDRDTQIDHWGVWRETAPPKTYFLWAARLRRGQQRTYKSKPPQVVGGDPIEALVREAHALVDTYLDGAGLVAWRTKQTTDGYEAVPLSPSARVTSLDDVLHRMASEIKQLTRGSKAPPAPVRPSSRAVGNEQLLLDESS